MQQKQTQSSWFNLKFLCTNMIFFSKQCRPNFKMREPLSSNLKDVTQYSTMDFARLHERQQYFTPSNVND